jgi:hypothetical protein
VVKDQPAMKMMKIVTTITSPPQNLTFVIKSLAIMGMASTPKEYVLSVSADALEELTMKIVAHLDLFSTPQLHNVTGLLI